MCVLATQFPVSNHDIIHKMTAVISTQLSRHNFFCFSQQKIFCVFLLFIIYILLNFIIYLHRNCGLVRLIQIWPRVIKYIILKRIIRLLIVSHPLNSQTTNHSAVDFAFFGWTVDGRERERERQRIY